MIFPAVQKLVAMVMPDATFTGRTDIWEVGVQAVAQRPITGYGFSAFFGTPEVVYGLGESQTWANEATDAHNAYLNLALTIGLPGLLLTILWIVVLPICRFLSPALGCPIGADAIAVLAGVPLRHLCVVLRELDLSAGRQCLVLLHDFRLRPALRLADADDGLSGVVLD